MKYGINMDCFEGLEPKKAAKLMKENGFSTTFVGTYYPNLTSFLPKLKQTGLKLNLCMLPSEE